MKLAKEKVANLRALADSRGVIAAVAMDQRGSLRKAIAATKGVSGDDITDEMMSEFKTAVSRVLSPHASSILLDPVWGLPAAEVRAGGAGLLLAYEQSGYDNTRPGRMADLLPEMSARRINDLGANAVKVLLYYTPLERPTINDRKHAFVERIGDECRGAGLPFFLELLSYDAASGDEKGFEFAKIKPQIVADASAEFSQDKYNADVLKVEIPVNTKYAEGAVGFGGERAYTKSEALDHYRRAAAASSRPFIYLSAGVSNEEFTEALEWAGDAGVNFSGVLCGRATWKDGIAVYAAKGVAALEDWLADKGVRNISAVNAALGGAGSWYGYYGAESPEALIG